MLYINFIFHIKIEIYILLIYNKMSQDNTDTNSQQDDNDYLFESFAQFGQRCTICADWLFGCDEIVTDPNHKWQMVHKDCVFIEEPVNPKERNIEDSISNQNNKSKKRNIEDSISNQNNKSKKSKKV
jgi:hypothetical protein